MFIMKIYPTFVIIVVVLAILLTTRRSQTINWKLGVRSALKRKHNYVPKKKMAQSLVSMVKNGSDTVRENVRHGEEPSNKASLTHKPVTNSISLALLDSVE